MPWSSQRNEDDYSTEVQQFPFPKETVEIPLITSVDEKNIQMQMTYNRSDSFDTHHGISWRAL